MGSGLTSSAFFLKHSEGNSEGNEDIRPTPTQLSGTAAK